MKKIDCFDGEYRFLSNFYYSPMIIRGVSYSTVEHYYQSMKATNPEDLGKILSAKTPGIAKKIGGSIPLIENWDSVKLKIMEEALITKFTQNRDLRQKLIATGDAILQEGNWWGDTFWGVCEGKGKNHLGRILMKIRKALREIDNV